MEQTDKLTWVNLRHAIAQATGSNDKEVNAFLQSLIEQLTTAFKNGESVRVNGLGTFRVQTTAQRNSINIATGESILINGYRKVTLLSDLHAKQSVNDTPKQTEEINPLQKLSEQADEIMGILADINQTQEKQEKPEKQETPDIQDAPVVPDTTDTQVVRVEPEIPAVPETPEEPKVPETSEKPARPFRPWLVIGVTMTVFALLLIAAFLFLQTKIEQWVNRLSDRTTVITRPVEEMEDLTYTDITEYEAVADVPEDTLVISTAEQPILTQRTYKRFITTERIRPGSRLSWLAYRYYGNKDLWVFIYEANRDRLRHPSHVVIGTPIRIPKLDAELRDTTNPETQRLIQQLSREFLNDDSRD